MSKVIDAVYENGVFKPVKKVEIKEVINENFCIESHA